MLKLTDVKATLGDIVSGLKMFDDEVRQVCRIPLQITAHDQEGEVLKALHLGRLHSAIYTSTGALAMAWFKQIVVQHVVSNCSLQVAFLNNDGRVELSACDLTRLKVKPLPDFELEITAVVKATLTPSQLMGLYRLQPYTELRASISENQDALSLVEA